MAKMAVGAKRRIHVESVEIVQKDNFARNVV